MATNSGKTKRSINLGTPLTERQLEVLNKNNWLDYIVFL